MPVKEDCTVLIYTGTHQCQLPLSADKVETEVVAKFNTLEKTTTKWLDQNTNTKVVVVVAHAKQIGGFSRCSPLTTSCADNSPNNIIDSEGDLIVAQREN